MGMKLLYLTPLALFAACGLTTPQRDAAPVDRLAAECALLAQASDLMSSQGSLAPEGLRDGCPGVSARDIRPLAQQTASLRTANAANLPATVIAGTRAEIVFRRMITRGVPPEIAAALAASEEFTAATQ